MTDELMDTLAKAAARRDVTTYRAVFLGTKTESDRAALASVASDPAVVVVDTIEEQLEELVRGRSPRNETMSKEEARAKVAEMLGGIPASEFGAWVFYPWRGRLVHVLPEALHREVRLDRNQYKITAAEQARLLSLRISVAGLSVGRAVVSTLVHEGIGGELRLADFDTLSLSNLNRVHGGLVDIGVSKVVLAAREVAELDPYVKVTAFFEGVEERTLPEFVDGADIVVDECDDLAMKLLLRERARASRLPLVMATSDRGMLDIERFDLEPDRGPFHGMLSGISSAQLKGLTTKQKVPYILRILDAERVEERTVASFVEVKETLSTWPQLASDVVLGGAMVANAVRRIALGELSCSGRFLADIDALIADGRQAELPPPRPFRPEPASVAPPVLVMPPPSEASVPTHDELRFVVACATRAPSASNLQPWRFEARSGILRARIDPERATSLLDDGRAARMAMGAALEAAMLGATALGFDAEFALPDATDAASSLWELRFARTTRPRNEDALRVLCERCSNRRKEPSAPIEEDVLRVVASAGSPLDVVLIPREHLAELGNALGAVDRVRLMSGRFRRELFSEVRFTREEALATKDGLDVASLELDATDLAVMQVLRSGTGMALLRRLGHGHALGNAARTAFKSSGAALVVRANASSTTSLVEAGRGLLRLWLEATRRGLAIHPWGAPLLFQRLFEAEDSFEPWEREELAVAAKSFREQVPPVPGLQTVLVLRISKGEPPTARSLRRDVDDVLVFGD